MSSSQSQKGYSVRPVDRVRGVHDRTPDEYVQIDRLRRALSDLVTAHDYRIVETPIIEHTELFMRKSGGERLAQIYAFNHRGRELALRPEHTASIVRSYVDSMQSLPLPLRLAYCGPVFRYETPQAGRSRQFTEFGCELIGAGGIQADVEIIRLALDATRAAGTSQPRLVLGHIGIVSEFLASLHIDQRAQDWLIWTMERLRDNQDEEIEIPEYLITPPGHADSYESLDHLDQAGVIALLRQSGVQFDGLSRSPEEIVSGLFEQRQRRYDIALMQDALDFVRQVTRLSGAPEEVLGKLRSLATSRGIDPAPLDDIDSVIEMLTLDDEDQVSVTVDLGMARGLRYYTGMLFEIYSPHGNQQICGGGRYDDLAQVLGSRSAVEACGFSLGIERAALLADLIAPPTAERRALVWSSSNHQHALKVAKQLRDDGWTVAVDPRDRSESAARRSATRQGYDVFVRVQNGSVDTIPLSGNQRDEVTS